MNKSRRGLTHGEVEESRRIHGTNVLSEKKPKSFLRRYLSAFSDPIIRILLGALVLNVIMSYRDINWFEIGGIVAAILFSTLVSTVSEGGSESAFRRMMAEGDAEQVRVRRDGGIESVPIGDLVVGDVVLLEAGGSVWADGELIFGEITVDQSALNGESVEVKKRPKEAGKGGGDSLDRPEFVARGSLICAGTGEMWVSAVGDATYYGKAATELQNETRVSPLKHRLSVLASNISFLGYVAAGMVAFAYLFNSFVIASGMDWVLIREKLTDLRFVLAELLQAFTMAVSIIVVAVPEGLPMMIAVVLSSNTKRMLRDHVIVRKLVGIETAGSLNLLFTDKTGTLTEGKLTASAFFDSRGEPHDALGSRRLSNIKSALAPAMILNNSAVYAKDGTPLGENATDRAILAFAKPWREEAMPPILARYPFDSDKKFSAVAVSDLCLGGKRWESAVLLKGAPEYLLPRMYACCTADGTVRKAEARDKNLWQARLKELAADAYRVLAFAVKLNSTDPDGGEDLIFIGLLALRDRIRKEAKSAIAEVRRAGIHTVMITGDNPLTAAAIAKECGVLSDEHSLVLTGTALRSMTDDALRQKIPDLAVVARAVPSDKTRLVRLAQELDLVVGMTGDGINDAPALKCADVGFAMGSGTDVAKEAGDILIADNNFASISRAILYGRTILDSIRKFIVFQLTMNLCAVGICLIGPFIGIEEPVTVTQMLWVNMIMDTLGGLAFAGEPPKKEYMRHLPKSRDEKLLTSAMLNQILLLGSFAIGLCIWFLKSSYVSYALSVPGEAYRLSAFFAMFIFCGIFISFNARTSRMNLTAHLAGNKPFLLIMLLISCMQMLFIYFGGDAFRAVPLKLKDLLFVILVSGAVIPADLLRKGILRGLRKRRKAARARYEGGGVVKTSTMSS